MILRKLTTWVLKSGVNGTHELVTSETLCCTEMVE